jgi:3-oxoacyl-[acyl-carrier protein] reductase
MSLQGKYALITGSSRGIGKGIAVKLAANGVNVAVHYYQNEAAANDTEAGLMGTILQSRIAREFRVR